MIKIEDSIVIKRSAKDIFEFLSNPDSDPLWQTQVVKSQKSSDGPMGLGATVAQESHFLGKSFSYESEVTLYEPDQNFAWKVMSGPFQGGGGWSLEPIGENETSVTVHAEFEVGSFFKMAEPLMTRAGKRQNAANFATLKEILEAQG
jgi:ribosome-associated toxin RatA of RatAB toxin-antitoxin module